MKESIWMSRVKAVAVTTFLAVGGLLLPTVYAHADLYNYGFSSPSFNIKGTFEANPSGINSTTSAANFVNFTGMGTFGINSISVNSGSGNTLFITAGVLLNTTIISTGQNKSFGTAGIISGDGKSFSFGDNFAGVFSAALAPSSGGGGSGGAPSPEVNVALGLAMASGTVAFLRRRKKNAAKSDA